MSTVKSTTVTPGSSMGQLQDTLRRDHAVSGFAVTWETPKDPKEPGRAVVAFHAYERSVRFAFDVPRDPDTFRSSPAGRTRDAAARRTALEAEERRLWRETALSIKAKLDVVGSGLATFDEEFMAHIVLPNGQTVGEQTAPAIAEAYSGQANFLTLERAR